ncbi:hypothetical protein R3P38DRAFT_2930086 [Favolaschia claudopus]|uniref:Uncharacterized protein n=1 Tax=Favolaschia claudopus TaxID=2862362 RepID=A0AAW0BX09_9AGAR
MNTSEAVALINSHLGGPNKILDWLVSQVKTAVDGIPENASDASEALPALPIQAALQTISLEADELQMLSQATKRAPTGAISRPATDQVDSVALSGYIHPWRTRYGRYEDYLESEATRLEAHTQALKSQLQQSKIASQSLSRAIQFLASELENTGSGVQATDDELSEVSLKADASILAAVDNSLRLIEQCASHKYDEDESSLSMVSSAYMTRIEQFQSQTQLSCGRLEAAFRKFEVNDIDLRLNPAIACLLVSLEDPDTGKDIFSNGPSVVQTATELEAAWGRDQAAILDARYAVLNEAITGLSDGILPVLTALYEKIATRKAHVEQTQALGGALKEEIQEITATREQSPPRKAKDAEMQAALTSLLKQLKDLRPHDAPALVLLDQDDIVCEVTRILSERDASRRHEEDWIAGLLPTLRKMESAHTPLLDVAYASSSMNSALPFSVPPNVETVHVDAERKAEKLGDAIVKLKEDMKALTSERATRRMEQFVSKWG